MDLNSGEQVSLQEMLIFKDGGWEEVDSDVKN